MLFMAGSGESISPDPVYSFIPVIIYPAVGGSGCLELMIPPLASWVVQI